MAAEAMGTAPHPRHAGGGRCGSKPAVAALSRHGFLFLEHAHSLVKPWRGTSTPCWTKRLRSQAYGGCIPPHPLLRCSSFDVRCSWSGHCPTAGGSTSAADAAMVPLSAHCQIHSWCRDLRRLQPVARRRWRRQLGGALHTVSAPPSPAHAPTFHESLAFDMACPSMMSAKDTWLHNLTPACPGTRPRQRRRGFGGALRPDHLPRPEYLCARCPPSLSSTIIVRVRHSGATEITACRVAPPFLRPRTR